MKYSKVREKKRNKLRLTGKGFLSESRFKVNKKCGAAGAKHGYHPGEQIQTQIHTYLHTYIHTYMHTYMHTYTPTYMHTYIHDTAKDDR